jgi:hypothetical protein
MLKETMEATMPCSPVKQMQRRKTASKELVHPHALLGVRLYIRNPWGDEGCILYIYMYVTALDG